MAHDLQQTLSLLSRTPSALDALLRNLPEAWTHRNEGEGTWTVYDVIGHLAYGERTDWPARARQILSSRDVPGSEIPAFQPFDRLGQQRESQGKSLPQLLGEFATLRSQNLAELQSFHLSLADLELRGLHPAFGPVTLSQLLATWVTHDLTHLHQISRILAHQYRGNVGPWSAYLGVLHCDGHSSS
jgi:DinB family protein